MTCRVSIRILSLFPIHMVNKRKISNWFSSPWPAQPIRQGVLEICHFDPETGDDIAAGVCEAACYDCLLEYGNQPDHPHIDRHLLN